MTKFGEAAGISLPAEQAGRAAVKRLRIVHIAGSVDPASGGPATVSIRLAAAQAALGHEVTVVSCLPPESREAFAAATAQVAGLHRVQLLLCPWRTQMQRWLGMRLLPIYESLLPFVDVVHLHGVWEMMLVMAGKHAKRHGVPYVVRPCGMLDPWSLRQRGFKKRLALTLTHEKFLRKAAFLHVLNADESRLIEPLHLSPPHRVIPNGVDLEEVDDTKGDAEFARRFPQLVGKRYILFVGRLHYKKGLDLLAEGFARIAARHGDVQLLVVGPDGGARWAFLKRIDAQGLSERVHCVGPLYNGIKFAAYRNAACLCLPSRQEGFSLTVLEALGSRTPVAISMETHFPEVATAGAGEVFALDPAAIGASLDRLLSATAAQRRQMGEAGRRMVEERYTWERIAPMACAAYVEAGAVGDSTGGERPPPVHLSLP